ncbi:MAG: GNAT family N-acetyltransferase [Chthonomonadales bacterium]|nr:GNAT family N-acetyltransferase [Chthonomonadales bacterium]
MTGPAPRIRPARSADAAEIARIVRESYANLPGRHVPADMPIYHPEYHAVQMLDPITRWALACSSGVPVGVAMWRLLPGLAHLHLLFVAGSHQGRGVGVALLKHHQREARREQRDTRLLTLHCLRDSHWAVRFYERHGYTEYEAGDEGRIVDLHLWIDACRRHDSGWPLRSDKALFYKRLR